MSVGPSCEPYPNVHQSLHSDAPPFLRCVLRLTSSSPGSSPSGPCSAWPYPRGKAREARINSYSVLKENHLGNLFWFIPCRQKTPEGRNCWIKVRTSVSVSCAHWRSSATSRGLSLPPQYEWNL